MVRFFPRSLPVELSKFGIKLSHRGADELAIERDFGRIGVRWSGERRLGISRCGEHGLKPRCFNASSHKLAGKPVAISVAFGRVELNQNIACPHGISILNVDGTNDTAAEWLDDLAASGRHHLSKGGRDDVDMPEDGPDQRNGKEYNDCSGDGATGRRGRSLNDFERGRKKFTLVSCPCRDR